MRLVEYYDSIARDRTPHYQPAGGVLRFLLHGPVERYAHRQVRRAVAGANSVADIGCGFGSYLVGLEHVGRVFLSDLSPEMVRTARTGLERRFPHLVVSSWTGEIAGLQPEQVGTYDLAMCVGMINHMENAQLGPVLDKLARIATRTILLYYAHTRFVLAAHVGVSFRRRGIHYECHAMQAVERRLAAHGFQLAKSSYPLGVPIISPMVMQEFRRAPGKA